MDEKLVEIAHAVWGCGYDPGLPRYIREADFDAGAAQIAAQHGWDGNRPEAWAVTVVVDEHSLDANTRGSSRVEGWIALPFDVDE